MKEEVTSTEPTFPSGDEALDLKGLRKSVAVFVFQVVAATTLGTQRCFLREDTAGTTVEVVAESSTQLRKLTPEIQGRLNAMLDAARHDIIEDGMSNSITERLAGLFLSEVDAVVPALSAVIENGRTSPIIASELLKELGRIRDSPSHPVRLWLLERALNTASPYVRDGAALGLARLADPTALRYLQRAIELEPNAETRADLQLVVDELSETVR